MNKAVKIILIIAGSLFALIVAVIILAFAYVIVNDNKTVPDSDDLSGGIENYLNNRDKEKIQALMAEAMDREYPVNWPMLWIVVKRTNMDAQDPDGNIRHFDIEMTDEETEYLLYEMPEMFASTVNEYTNGLVNVEITTLLYDEVNYMDTSDIGVNLCPDSYPDIKDSFSEYNTVMSTIRLQTTDGDTRIRSDWAGMAFTGLFDGNYGFAMAQTSQIPACEVPSLTAWSEDNPVPEEVYIHEWLHTFENFEETMKHCDGNPDTAGEHGYECLSQSGENGNYIFYRDLLTRNCWDDKIRDYVGMDEELWRTFAMLMDIAKKRVAIE